MTQQAKATIVPRPRSTYLVRWLDGARAVKRPSLAIFWSILFRKVELGARRRTRACTPCAAARAQLPACCTPLLQHALLRAAALKQRITACVLHIPAATQPLLRAAAFKQNFGVVPEDHPPLASGGVHLFAKSTNRHCIPVARDRTPWVAPGGGARV